MTIYQSIYFDPSPGKNGEKKLGKCGKCGKMGTARYPPRGYAMAWPDRGRTSWTAAPPQPLPAVAVAAKVQARPELKHLDGLFRSPLGIRGRRADPSCGCFSGGGAHFWREVSRKWGNTNNIRVSQGTGSVDSQWSGSGSRKGFHCKSMPKMLKA